MTRATLLAALLVLAPCTAMAEPVDAEAVYKEGIALRKEHRDQEALEKFTQAWDATHAPKARAQMALAEQALGKWVDAEAHLLEALAIKTDPWIQKQRALLEESLAEIVKHLGSLELLGGSEGAEVLVNGRSVGQLPLDLPLRIEAGTFMLELKKPGYYPVNTSVAVEAGATTRTTIEMRVVPPPAAAPAAPPEPPPAAKPPPVVHRSLVGDGDRQLVRPVTLPVWIGAAGAAVFALVGTGALVARNTAAGRHNDDPLCPGIGAPDVPDSCGSRAESVTRWQTASIASFAVAGAFATFGIVSYVLTPPRKPGGVAIRCGVALSGTSCTATF